MFGNWWYKKEKPLPGMMGFGGGATSLSNTGKGFGATGGNATVESPTHKYHVFTSPGTFAVTGVIPAVDIVVVGGGGGGYPGNPAGGGAGGGGVYIRTLSNQDADLLATIGEGGDPAPNTVGEASILATPTAPTAYVAPGGDRVGSPNAGGNSYPGPVGSTSGPYLFQSGQGGSASGDTGGGGGGAGGNGGNGSGTPCGGTGATGGNGYPASNFPGPVFAPIMPTDFVSALGPTGLFGGGGGGAIRCAPGGANTPGPGGPGGGGRGGAEPNHPGGGNPGRQGGNGVANTGGGGGGGHSYNAPGDSGGNGGDGIIICRYPV